jgi:hypothetical protein
MSTKDGPYRDDGSMWLLDFRTGEARKITRAEAAAMRAEMEARTTVRDGVLYIDCEPPPRDDAS